MKKILLISSAVFLLSLSIAPERIFAACNSQTPGAQAINDGSGGIAGWNCPDGTFTSSVTGETVQGTPTPTPTPTTPRVTPTNTTAGNLGYTPLEPIPGLSTNADGSTFFTDKNNLPSIVNAIFRILITIGALLAVLSLAVGGIQYMVSSSAELKNSGINRAKAALWGIVLIAASYLILYTINPRLLDFKLDPCPTGATGCTVTGASKTVSQPGYVPTASEISNATQAITNGVDPSKPDTSAQTLTDAQRTLDQANANDKANCSGTLISGAVTAGSSPMGRCNQQYSTCTVLTSNQVGSGVSAGIQYVCAQN